MNVKKKPILITITAVVLVGCGESQKSPISVESKLVLPASKAPDISIQDAAKEGNFKVIKQHIATGTDVNARDGFDGMTALRNAVWGNKREIIELLIASGADVDAKDNDGWTPLHHAARVGGKETVELLVAEGAGMNSKDDDGKTPLDRAFFHKRIETADFLRKHGGKTSEELKFDGE
ncbi:MAG: ankyrin repeat domain-containing protein [Verrucomicrobiota bacterium]|nr:ankyrin repeat domain-containing protein [Verrucomicrobiota bacterium]